MMKKLLFFPLFIQIFGAFVTTFAQSEAMGKPRLIDFGASLRPGYVKPNPAVGESVNSPKSDDEVIRVDTDLVVSDVLVNPRSFAETELKKLNEAEAVAKLINHPS